MTPLEKIRTQIETLEDFQSWCASRIGGDAYDGDFRGAAKDRVASELHDRLTMLRFKAKQLAVRQAA